MTEQTLRLDAGTLCLNYDPHQPDLFKVAERINAKRAFVFVSTVLGRHIPVAPRAHNQAAQQLAQKAHPHVKRHALVMGYAETAVGFGAAVARALRTRERDVFYLPTTRHAVEGHSWLVFEEGHSHATDQQVMKPHDADALAPFSGPLSEGRTLVLVDDETTTGKTFAALAHQMQEAGLVFDNVVVLTLTDWAGGAAKKRLEDTLGVPIVSESLFEGTWNWIPDDTVAPKVIPTYTGMHVRPAWSAPKDDAFFKAPRLGTRCEPQHHLQSLMDKGLVLEKDARVLVVGSGEHVWAPFLLAEEIEQKGWNVQFLATTRSPITPSDVIAHKHTFADHFGLGVPMYLHNVDPQAWDHILFMTETTSEGICPDLKSTLASSQVIDGNGDVFNMKDLS